MKVIEFLLFSVVTAISAKEAPDAPDILEVATRLTSAVQEGILSTSWFHYRNFGSWSYEGGVIIRGLWELQNVLPELELEDFLNRHLDIFLDTPDEFGYRILHNESLTYNDTSVILPWLYSIGDNIGLFPIVYADRLRYGTKPDFHPPRDDLYIISEVVEKYIYGYPWHLPDGSISRPITWLAEGFLDLRGGGIWVDDMYMGNALLIDYSLLSGDITHLIEAGNQILSLANILQDEESGLMKHGYHNWTGHHSCCFWGRGNGWALVSLTEFLSASKEMNLESVNPELHNDILQMFNTHLQAVLQHKGENGLWHNILTNNSTFQEISASSMFTMALSRGYRNGWIYDDFDYSDTIRQSWDAIQQNIQQDGTVANIIGGTGIKNDESGYTPSNTDYQNSGPGIGAVLRLTAEMVLFNRHLHL